MAVSVNAVYTAIKNLANKDQQGFITPSEFNSFAEVAQLTIYNRMFSDIKNARRQVRAGINPARDKARLKQIEEDLSTYARSATVSKNSSGVFSKDDLDNLSRIISMTTFGGIMLDQSTRTPIELCYDEDKIERVLLSDISKPTESFPVALISQNIEVFPTSIQRIRVRYYKLPTSVNQDGTNNAGQPRYAENLVNQVYVFDSTTSRDFDLPEYFQDILVAEIAQMAGVNMRDQFVQGYGSASETEVKQERSL